MNRRQRRLRGQNDRHLIRGYRGSTTHAPKHDKPLATLGDAVDPIEIPNIVDVTTYPDDLVVSVGVVDEEGQ